MTDTKHISGLRLLNATRLALTNHDTSVPAIAVNGRKLSHADIDLGTLLIADGTVKTKDAVDGQYYEVLNSNSQIDVRFEEEIQAGKVQSGQIIPVEFEGKKGQYVLYKIALIIIQFILPIA